MAAVLHQIYYKNEQLPKLFDFAKPFYNPGLTIFFENAVLADIVMKSEAEKVGVASWKLKQKMRRGHNLTKDVLNSDYHVLSFTRNSSRHQMLAMSAAWHKGFIPAIDMLWQKLGYKRPHEARDPIYQNHWSGKTELYQDYVQNFLIPAINLINTDAELHNLMIQPSGYGALSRDSDLRSVKEKLNMSDYPLTPFILERCPSLWFTMKKIPVTYL